MKRLILLATIIAMANTSFAQDDLYFTAKKKETKTSQSRKKYNNDVIYDDTPVYHSGSNRSVDEYNRRGTFASRTEIVTDTTGNDIINFTPGDGTYPDSISLAELVKRDSLTEITRSATNNDDNDYAISRRMSRFDEFYPWRIGIYDPWFFDPWIYDPWFYDPWYYSHWTWHHPWYDPWFRPWHYDPWYWHGGWGPWYPGGFIVHTRGTAGTHNHGRFDPGTRGMATTGSHSISRGIQEHGRQETSTRGGSSRSGNFTGHRGATTTRSEAQPTRSYETNRPTYSPTYSSGSGNFGGGSFGGGSSRGGGSFGGGGGSRGGGNFGGRR